MVSVEKFTLILVGWNCLLCCLRCHQAGVLSCVEFQGASAQAALTGCLSSDQSGDLCCPWHHFMMISPELVFGWDSADGSSGQGPLPQGREREPL